MRSVRRLEFEGVGFYNKLFSTENPKTSGELPNFRKPHQDAHQESASLRKGKPAEPQKYPQAV